ncbi:MAG: NYN domain-containing protein [Planctomycetota bacterium]|nr:NYN domain-containing protein [Planctomycetota bacterium]
MMSASIARSFPQRIGVFVDVQNMFYSAKLLYQSKVDYGKLLREIVGNRQLVRAIAYIVQKSDVNQSGFHEALTRFGYELKIKELKVRPDNTTKGSWDVGIAIDSLLLAPKLDTVVLVTGDGDFAPLVEALKAQGCRVEVVSFDRSTASELIKVADQYIPISENLIFKEKKFEYLAQRGVADPARSAAGQYVGGPPDQQPPYPDVEDEEAQPQYPPPQTIQASPQDPDQEENEEEDENYGQPSTGGVRKDMGIFS